MNHSVKECIQKLGLTHRAFVVLYDISWERFRSCLYGYTESIPRAILNVMVQHGFDEQETQRQYLLWRIFARPAHRDVFDLRQQLVIDDMLQSHHQLGRLPERTHQDIFLKALKAAVNQYRLLDTSTTISSFPSYSKISKDFRYRW